MAESTPKPCSAKSKQTGEPCRKTCVPGSNVCRYHGGLSPRGAAAANFKEGRYSKYHLPPRLAERYQEAVRDPDLLSLRPAVAVMDARLDELFARMDSGESGGAWKELAETMVTVNQAIKSGDFDATFAGLRTITGVISRGAREEESWGEIRRTFEARRRIGETEQKRLSAMQQYITAENMMGMLATVQRLILQYVEDPDKRRSLGRELEQLVLVEPG